MDFIEVTLIKAGCARTGIKRFVGPPSLKEMQDVVGGYIELVRLDNGDYLVVNEEGILLNLRYNHLASEHLIAHAKNYTGPKRIVGDAFIIQSKHIQ